MRTTTTSCFVSNKTIVPFTRNSATGNVIVSTDIIPSNSTTFPNLSAIASRYDKIKYHRMNIRWITAVPTTTGGTISMYFDNDRKDAGATDATAAMQNANCRMFPVWQVSTYRLTRKQLRSNEMFTTSSGTSAAEANAENSFAGPGRVHLVSTGMTGVTISGDTVIGYLEIDYMVELCFPSNPSTGVPTRRKREIVSEVPFATYSPSHVRAWENFAAGCLHPPTFFQFLSMFDSEGTFQADIASQYFPDELSYQFDKYLRLERAPTNIIGFSGLVSGRPWESAPSDLFEEEEEHSLDDLN